jgi:hypothetical protein
MTVVERVVFEGGAGAGSPLNVEFKFSTRRERPHLLVSLFSFSGKSVERQIRLFACVKGDSAANSRVYHLALKQQRDC